MWRGCLTGISDKSGAICFQEEWTGREQLTRWLANGHRPTAPENGEKKNGILNTHRKECSGRYTSTADTENEPNAQKAGSPCDCIHEKRENYPGYIKIRESAVIRLIFRKPDPISSLSEVNNSYETNKKTPLNDNSHKKRRRPMERSGQSGNISKRDRMPHP